MQGVKGSPHLATRTEARDIVDEKSSDVRAQMLLRWHAVDLEGTDRVPANPWPI